MNCKNHPVNETRDRCGSCGQPFCFNCTVVVESKTYCAECKVDALEGRSLPAKVLEAYGGVRTSELAGEALTLSLLGIVCVGFVLEPMALYKGIQAKREIAENPHLGGEGKATAAIVISSILCALYFLVFIATLLEPR